jgi:hypothetical protein
LIGAPASAEPVEQRVTTAVRPDELARPRRELDPGVASRVFGFRVTSPRDETPAPAAAEPEIEPTMPFDLPSKETKKKKKWPFPIQPTVMKSLSKGRGNSGGSIGLKFRF